MSKYCVKCGEKLEEDVKFCPKCGTFVGQEQSVNHSANNTVNSNSKSKIAAGLLGIFLGSLGIHNFYLGYNSKAIAQLILTMVGWIFCGIGPVVAAIWGLIEGILILTGSINQDAAGNQLID